MDFHTAAQQIMWSRRVLRQFTRASTFGAPALSQQKSLSSSIGDGDGAETPKGEPPGLPACLGLGWLQVTLVAARCGTGQGCARVHSLLLQRSARARPSAG